MVNVNNKRFSLVTALMLAIVMIVTACSDNSVDSDGESENLKTGFIINVQTPSETYLTKYVEELPSGTVDLSDGTDFQSFSPRDLYDGALFMPRTDGSAGFSKMVVNSEGEIVEEGGLPAVDESTFFLKVRDAEVGIYHDRNTPDELTVFNPTDLSITGTIDMSEAFSPAPQRYQTFFFRDDLVFAPIRPEVGGTFDSTIVHIADLSTGSYVGTTTKNSGESMPVLGFGKRTVDESGNIYVPDTGNPTGSNPVSTILKIPAGSNEFDPDYDFTPALIANPSNQLLPATNGMYYHQDGKAYTIVATETPQELIDLVASVGGNSANLSDEQIQQALNILYTAENGSWSELDLESQTVTEISGIPMVSPFNVNTVTEVDGKLYFPVVRQEENALYEYNPVTGEVQKAFDVEGGSLMGVYNLSNNN